MKKGKIVCVVGPTGVGKSALAVTLAAALDGEIVNADSRQVYKYMDIGTAKPTTAERGGIVHHLLDVAEPCQVFSVAAYQEQAQKAINDILNRQKVPLLVGGSGQYIRSLLEGWQIPAACPDRKLRDRLEEEAQSEEGRTALRQRLLQTDPQSYERIDLHNMRRVIRALEASYQNKEPFSAQRRQNECPYDVLLIGLTMEREELYIKVDQRVDGMIKKGMINETQQLLQQYPHKHSVLATIGYKQLTAYLNGQCTLQEALQRIKFETHRYIRQQYTWFKPSDEDIHWFTLGSKQNDTTVTGDILTLIRTFLSFSGQPKVS